eukprot:scaffold162693_cov24-Cyclotella_meneghiniana.AAC.2
MSEHQPPPPPSARMAGLNAAVASLLGTGARPPATSEDSGEDVGGFSTPGPRDERLACGAADYGDTDGAEAEASRRIVDDVAGVDETLRLGPRPRGRVPPSPCLR